MAGSSRYANLNDPVLIARLEGLTQLAEHVAEPVVIVTPDLALLYVNPAARQHTESCSLLGTVLESSSGSSSKQEPCEACPAITVLDSQREQLFSTPASGVAVPSSCPFPLPFPLLGKDGQLGSVLMLGKTGRETRLLVHAPCPDTPGDEPTAAPHALDRLIGDSQAMQQILEMIRLVSSSEAPVLLQGESGTGKELVARTIHQLSRRRNQPFVVVDCGSLPESLLESELFGHVRGAFTGAVAHRKGLFEEAEGGTIFLDEIGDTSPVFQAKLLRVLQEQEIKPVGSSQSVKVNVRIVSASNKPLEELAKSKVFRADLYYRLAVLPLALPPLRERREDIPLLINFFVRQSSEKNGKKLATVHPDVVRALTLRSWPGNVRELEHFIERLVVTARSTEITMDNLLADPSALQHSQDLHAAGRAARVHEERARIIFALSEARGNRSRAAKILQISRASLYNKIREYGIS